MVLLPMLKEPNADELIKNTYLRNACVTWCARLLGKDDSRSRARGHPSVSTNIKNCDEKDSVIFASAQVQCAKRQWDHASTEFSLQF